MFNGFSYGNGVQHILYEKRQSFMTSQCADIIFVKNLFDWRSSWVNSLETIFCLSTGWHCNSHNITSGVEEKQLMVWLLDREKQLVLPEGDKD